MCSFPFFTFVTFFVIFKISTAQVLNYGALSNTGGINPANAIPNQALTTAALANNGQVLSPQAVAHNINSKVANVEHAALNTIAAINTANVVHEVTAPNLAALAAATFAAPGNIATFNLNHDGIPFTITSGSLGSPGFGIQVLAEALEVGGKVNVNGEIPIYGTVSVNGNVPTDGAATVSYSCGRPVQI